MFASRTPCPLTRLSYGILRPRPVELASPRRRGLRQWTSLPKSSLCGCCFETLAVASPNAAAALRDKGSWLARSIERVRMRPLLSHL